MYTHACNFVKYVQEDIEIYKILITTMIPFDYWVSVDIHLASYGRGADEIQLISEFFKIHYRSK